MENVCKFISVKPTINDLQIINFVCETKGTENFQTKISSVYRINYVINGEAIIQCGVMRKKAVKGDVFFIFPSVPYVIEGDSNFAYEYISFLGVKANVLTEKFGINYRSFLFENVQGVFDLWQSALEFSSSVCDFAYEGILYYTLAQIADKFIIKNSTQLNLVNSDRFMLVKKYIDDNFSNANFSLSDIAKEFGYNKKYISTAFKKRFKVCITDYVNTIKINHACILMEQNYTSVSDIAYLCGFTDPMYFSRLFKLKMKISPKEYIYKIQKTAL